MTFTTTKYEFAHGRKPKGRGNWAFEILGTDGVKRGDTFWANDTYAGARKQAEVHARAIVGRHGTVVVGS